MNKLSLRSAHRVVAFVDVVDSVGLYRRVGDEAAQLRIDEALALPARAPSRAAGAASNAMATNCCCCSRTPMQRVMH